jgi:hypothetical protein
MLSLDFGSSEFCAEYLTNKHTLREEIECKQLL